MGTSSSPDKLNAGDFPCILDDVLTDLVFRLYSCCRIDFISCMDFEAVNFALECVVCIYFRLM